MKRILFRYLKAITLGPLYLVLILLQLGVVLLPLILMGYLYYPNDNMLALGLVLSILNGVALLYAWDDK